MKRIIMAFTAAVMLAGMLTGCVSAPDTAEKTDKLSIISTIFPYYDFARAVCGDTAEVSMLISPSAEIHSFDPSPSDIIAIQNCDVFLYTGSENDVWVEQIFESVDTSGITIVKLIDTVELTCADQHEDDGHEHEHEHEHSSYDDHIWTSPLNAVTITEEITDAVCAKDPDNAETYRKNSEAYISEIMRTDEIISGIVNESENSMLVFGDRFPMIYFTERYGLDYLAAFNGCSTETDCSAATMATLIDYIEENNVKYIYTIELSNKNIANALSEQTGAEILTLQSCQNISKEDFDNGETYVSLMERNAEELRKGLS